MIDVDAEGDLGLPWDLEASHFPEPVTRWTHELFVRTETAVIAELAVRYGFLFDGVAMKEIDGRVYTTIVPLGGKPAPTPPAWLVPVLVRIVPMLRRRIRTARAAARSGAYERAVERWLATDEPRMLGAARRLLDLDLAPLDDAGLARVLEEALALAREGTAQHFELHAAGLDAVGRLGFRLTSEHGWPAGEVAELFTGLSDTSTGPAAAQARIVELVSDAGAADGLRAATTLDDVRALSPAVAAAVDAYLHDWGGRAVRYEVAYPTVAERPEWLVRVLREQAGRPHAAGMADRHARRREELRRRAEADLGDRHLVERALRVFPLREGNETATIGMPVAALRRVGLEIGARLAADGRLERGEDVFDLEIEEVLAVLRGAGGVPADPAAVARDRRERRERAGRADPPSHVGPPAPEPPDLTGFPPDIAEQTRALLWYVGQIEAVEERPATETAGVSGLGAAPGAYEGTARVVHDESGFDRIEPGDVLVCPITSPVWSMVFPLLGALVCDAGGIMSHPAIIAREFGIPCVVATGDATRAIADGATVRVDGDAGSVTVLEDVPVS